MDYAIVIKSIAALWGGPAETTETDGQVRTAIADEVLCGMGLAVTGAEQNGFYSVRTHYGYSGYIKKEDILPVTLEELQVWEASELMAVSGICVDITSLAAVQGVIEQSLFRGALVRVLEFDSAEKTGWARVQLPDGRTGYMRNQYLMKKNYSQAGLWEQELPQCALRQLQSAAQSQEEEGQSAAEAAENSESAFRDAVVRTAMSYLGVQYRWGGKSTAGIDCSGLTSMSYMLNGILVYRDAKIKPGYPVHEISQEQMKKGDLLYFPGHIAMYLGNHRYIHSTGRIGSGGVVINSLNPLDEDYREDLVKSLYAVGSIF